MKENKLLKEKIKSLEKELNENLCIECNKFKYFFPNVNK